MSAVCFSRIFLYDSKHLLNFRSLWRFLKFPTVILKKRRENNFFFFLPSWLIRKSEFLKNMGRNRKCSEV